jgi:DNA-binding response OmpR family regulator
MEAMQAGMDEFMTKPFDEDQLQARLIVAGRVAALQQHVLTLEGLLPICPYCKRIREGTGEWKTLELYVADHSDAKFSHGVCPDCFKIVLAPPIPKDKST